MTSELEIVELEQGQTPWHHWREKKLTASHAPIIAGAAPSYWGRKTWDDLRKPAPEPDDYAKRMFARGHRLEAAYRNWRGGNWAPMCISRGKYGASLDLAREGLLGWEWEEVKAPMKLASNHWKNAYRIGQGAEGPLAHVWWQMVHQAAVFGDQAAPTAFYTAIHPSGRVEESYTALVSTDRLLADWEWLRGEWEAWEAGEKAGLRDEAWVTAAHQYLEADLRYNTALQERKEARLRLIGLAEETDTPTGAGVSVITSKRPGSIDWRHVLKTVTGLTDEEVDEAGEKHRKPSYTISQVRKVRQ